MIQGVYCLMAILFALFPPLSCSNGGGSNSGAQPQTYTVRYEGSTPYVFHDISYWDENNEEIVLQGINTENFTYEFQTSDVMQTIGIIGNYYCTGPFCSSISVPLTVRLYIDGVEVAKDGESGPFPEVSIGPDSLNNFLNLLDDILNPPEPEPHVTKFLDAFIVNSVNQSPMVFWNDGFSYFSLSEQSLWMFDNRDVDLGDLDGDGDLDAFVVASQGGCCDSNQVYLVDVYGTFYYTGQGSPTFGKYNSFGVALGDLDGDNDLDAFVANYYGEANKVYFNDGLGIFSDAGQSLGSDNSYAVELGDLDGDGDLDSFIVNDGEPNKIYFNDGNGGFVDSGQALGEEKSLDVALGDLDGDGDLDAFVVNHGDPNKIYLNNGSGIFIYSGQVLGTGNSTGIALGDVNGDSYIDAFVTNEGQANRIYLNDGLGVFADSGQALGSSDSFGVDLGDVDGDGDLDAAVVNRYAQPNKLYFNDGAGIFTDSGQTLGRGDSMSVIFGKINP